MKEKTLTLCVITKNEERYFPHCLKAMEDVADEIIVIDLGTKACTERLAELVGASVFKLDWEDDFSKIKNFCMDCATGKWVMFLQADEFISQDQFEELKTLMKNPVAEAYIFDFENIEGDRLESTPSQTLRLIRNRDNYRFRYRSFEYMPDEEMYSMYRSWLKITCQGETDDRWQVKERTRILQLDYKENPDDGYVMYLKGLEALSQNDYREAAKYLELSHELFNGGYFYSPHMYKCFGLSLLNLERYEAAEAILTEGLFLFPFYTDLLVMRAQLYSRLNHNEEAIEDLKTAADFQNTLNVCIPVPEIDVLTIKEMLLDIWTD